MRNLRILTMAVPLTLLPAAGISAQARLVLTGGFTSSVEESCHARFTRPILVRGVEVTACDKETHYRTARHATGFSAGLSGIIPLQGALEIELGGVLFRHDRWHLGNQLALMALGRVNLPLAEHGSRAFLMVGPTVAGEICPNGRIYPGSAGDCHGLKWDVDVTLGAGVEYGLADDLGLTLGTVYRHGLRNFSQSPLPGEFIRLRSVTIRGGLVYRID